MTNKISHVIKVFSDGCESMEEGSKIHNADSECDISSLIYIGRKVFSMYIYDSDCMVVNRQPCVLEGELNLHFCGIATIYYRKRSF